VHGSLENSRPIVTSTDEAGPDYLISVFCLEIGRADIIAQCVGFLAFHPRQDTSIDLRSMAKRHCMRIEKSRPFCPARPGSSQDTVGHSAGHRHGEALVDMGLLADAVVCNQRFAPDAWAIGLC
jgi:hypothetical protein